MKKHVLSMAAAACLAMALTACSGGAAETTAADTTAAETADTTAAEAEDTTAAEAESSEAADAEGGVLIMATNAEFPPYEYHEGGEIVGIDAEIAAAIAEHMGLTLQIEDIAFDSIIPEVVSGKADMAAAGMTVTEDRQEFVDFSDTYATAVQSIIVPEGSDITGPEGLAGKKIGVQQGTTGDIYTTDEFGDENIERYNKGVDAVQALVQGKVDAVVIDNEPAKVFVSETEGLVLLETAYAEEEYAIAVKKGNTELLEQINAALADLKESGALQEIVDKYITAE